MFYIVTLISLFSSLLFGENLIPQYAIQYSGGSGVYIDYLNVPDRIYRGQIFPVTFKLTVISENFDEVEYRFKGGKGVQLLSETPDRTIIDSNGIVYAEDKFYFKATDTDVVLPNVAIYVNGRKNTSLSGRRVDGVIELPPSQNFSHVFAKHLEIYKVIADRYDEGHNILTMFIRAEMSDLQDIHFNEPYIFKQGIESKRSSGNFRRGKVIFFVILPKYYDNFVFKYFNTDIFDFQKIRIPFRVKNDMVTTAKDFHPKTLDRNFKIKLSISIGLTILFLVLFYHYQNWINIILASISLLIAISLIVPKPEICVRDGAVIRILPMESSTGFENVEGNSYFEKIATRGKFIKIRISDSSEGWIKVEDVCQED